MTDRAQELLREALTLPIDQRADVAAELLASLDEPSTMDAAAVEAAWAREIERRARRVIAGESVGEPWEDVRGHRHSGEPCPNEPEVHFWEVVRARCKRSWHMLPKNPTSTPVASD